MPVRPGTDTPRVAASAGTPKTSRGRDDGDAYTELPALFTQWSASPPHSARWTRLREQIVHTAMPLAEHIALRYRGRGEPHEDLLQVARIGLLKAVDRYEINRGDFVAFAVPTIMGEVKRYFRDHTWTMRVPRGIQEASHLVRVHTEVFTQRTGRPPTVRELAAETDLDPDTITLALTCDNAYRPDSLDKSVTTSSGDADPLEAFCGAEDRGYDLTEQRLTVAPLLAQLSDRDRTILQLRFFDSMNQSQIAAQLGLSQMHISRILTRILTTLRTRALADPAPAAPRLIRSA